VIDHRPLSEWVTVLPVSPDGRVRWDPGYEVNFGDERADARELGAFQRGWQRRSVRIDGGYDALALVNDPASAAVIELGDVATPIRITPDGANAIARLEEDWPHVIPSPADLAVLSREGTDVRYLLLARLEAEGRPESALFHILPWERVDRLAAEVSAVLDGGPPPRQITFLGHWFTPAGSRITAALEQLDQGLRDQDPVMARVAQTALCGRALEADVTRLPSVTRQALAGLIGRLAERDRFLAFSATAAARRLRNAGGTVAAQEARLRLDARLPAAADSATGIRRMTTEVVSDPFTVELAVTATGRTEVSVRAPLPAEQAEWLSQLYGVPLQPVDVVGARGPTRYLIPLSHSGGEVAGRLNVATPSTQTVEASLAGPPIGASEARYLTAADVQRSIRGLRSRSDLLLWDRIAATLPADHPLRSVIAGETQ
jgi:hypothetical protein